MKHTLMLITLAGFILTSCNSESDKAADNKTVMNMDNETSSTCTDKCQAKNKIAELSCKLTSPELQQRKATVLESLRKQILEKKELKNGYAFKFPGTDKMIDELAEFIKTERECCDFFIFNLSISGDKSEIWLELTGIDGAKEFIKTELEM